MKKINAISRSQRLFDNRFSDHSTYNDPKNLSVSTETGGNLLLVQIRERKGARKAKFIFDLAGDLVAEWYSGHQGGQTTGYWSINSGIIRDGRGAKRDHVNVGSRGSVKDLKLADENTVEIPHKYKTRRYYRSRTWILEV